MQKNAKGFFSNIMAYEANLSKEADNQTREIFEDKKTKGTKEW